MVLIISKQRPNLGMTELMHMVLKFIYDGKSMTAPEERMLFESFSAWHEYFVYKKDVGACKACSGNGYYLGACCYHCGGKGYLMAEAEHALLETLQELAFLLRENEKGAYEKRKAMFAEHNIDYKKFFRLPGSVSELDRHKAKQALEKAKKANPEDYQ